MSKLFSVLVSIVVALTAMPAGTAQAASGRAATAAPAVGAGFEITPGDLNFILRQIDIGERHVATRTATEPCRTMLGAGADRISSPLASFGIRTVDGSCNNLFAGRGRWGASDEVFPRMVPARFKSADPVPAGFPNEGSPTSYTQLSGAVFDQEPRLISNAISDQTSTNPAAVAAAGHPVRSQGAAGVVPCETDPDPLIPGDTGTPAGCIPSGQTLPIPNVTTDAGLSPPFNGLFALFGQFFDHGVDQTVKGGGTVFVPLREDDPLVAGPDGEFGTDDDLAPEKRFMPISRARLTNGEREAINTDTPWVDQSQTYASHASHQVFLREYTLVDVAGQQVPQDTGRLLGGAAGTNNEDGESTWADTKKQAAEVLGLKLEDKDVLDVPMLLTDPYGNFVPGPDRGLPQYVTAGGLVEGDLANPVAVPADVERFDTPFLVDIAHNADPSPVDHDRDPSTPREAPVPDDNDTASHDFAAQPAGTYDDELLAMHFLAGDGRINENIGLTAIHQVFHSEHNRLVADIDSILHEPGNAALLAKYERTNGPSEWDYGKRLFQAARFINEMEYQHIVFEEFARKLQPALPPFTAYHPDTNAAIPAEFAHAVYRFGHSMLTDVVARRTADGTDYSQRLFDVFLNPIEYHKGPGGSAINAKEAAGAIFMGMSDQVGNEVDEFMTEDLRNGLLGIPLDLAVLNLARGRSEGMPPLNVTRRLLHQQTGEASLTPYASWSDFGQNLKHPETLVNFVAVYGKHPTILSANTLQEKRDAARLIVNPPSGHTPTQDELDFLFANGEWAVGETGLNDVDLWIGGLAESTQLFGGHLGSTFNYVFEETMFRLQVADRFYYLARTPGLNLRSQLEANTFSEMAMRNSTGAEAMKADAFATADCKFKLANLTGTGPNVTDDPSTECNENALLLRRPDGTIQYRAFNTEDPPGINGQAVYNGTNDVDRVVAGNDNDTILGNGGNDILEGYFGDDDIVGGDGDDRISDAGGADIPRGGAGDDVISAGPGDDITLAGAGRDFVNGGQNLNETFGGQGTDFVIAGVGGDVVFGGGGDDWIQGGSGQDLLQGDHGAPFFDDPGEMQPGNDVFVGQVGENDYDSEGGDDIMSQNAAVDRNSGSGGFDWGIHQYNTVGADDDLNINRNLDPLALPQVVLRDRWAEMEALSGSAQDDVLRGDEDVPATLGGAGLTGCNVLDQAGLDRIAGLDRLVPELTQPLGPVEAAAPMGVCPLTGQVWGAGNILLGGGGTDSIQGRGADDIIDGDRALQVRISVRNNPDNPASEIGSTTLLEAPYQTGNPQTLEAALLAGTVKPNQLVIVREIVDAPTTDTGVDTAVFQAPLSSYTLAAVEGDAFQAAHLLVTQTGPNGAEQKISDGVDIVRNIERLQFEDQTVVLDVPDAPTIDSVTGGIGAATVNFTPAASNGSPEVTGFEVQALVAGDVVQTVAAIPATATSVEVADLQPNVETTFRVRALNMFGASDWSALGGPITPMAPPDAPTGVSATLAAPDVIVNFTPGDPQGHTVTGFRVLVFSGGNQVNSIEITDPAATSATITGLTPGGTFTFRVRTLVDGGASAASDPSAPVTVPDLPGAPGIGAAVRGANGGARTATANWTAATNGGSPITGYIVRAQRFQADGVTPVPGTTKTSAVLPPGARQFVMTFTVAESAFRWRFTVRATNVMGDGPWSARSARVRPR